MRRADQEQWLDAAGIQWQYLERIGLDQFRTIGHNQVRFQTDEDRVLALAEQAKVGQQFPPLILEEDGKAGPKLLDGFHRQGAYSLADVASTDAYLVQPLNDLQRHFLTTVMNVRNGMAPSFEERIQAALDLVRLGLELKVAAREAGVHVRTLSGRISERETRERLLEVGLARIAKTANHTMLTVLGRIKNPKIFKRAAEAFVEAGDKSSTTYNDLVTEINRTGKTESDQLESITQWLSHHRTTIASTLRGIKPSAITTRISAVLSSVLNLRLERFDAKTISTEDRQRYKDHCKKAIAVLDRLLAELK